MSEAENEEKKVDQIVHILLRKELAEYGGRIKNARKNLKITQQDYAGSAASNQSKLETGQTSPTLKTLIRSAAKLGIGVRLQFYDLSEVDFIAIDRKDSFVPVPPVPLISKKKTEKLATEEEDVPSNDPEEIPSNE